MPAQPATVLLAEDEPLLCHLFRLVLEGAGLDVLDAGDGQANVEVIDLRRAA